MNYIYHKYPKVVELMNRRAESYNRLTRELLEEEKKGNLFLIAPRDTYGVSRTEGDWKLLGRLYQEGVDVAREQMDALRAYLET